MYCAAVVLILNFFGQELPVDTNATEETVNLYNNLKQLSGEGTFLFGHQDDLAYGVGWKDIPGRSDIKDLTGDYPALNGWDLAGIETGDSLNIVGVSFEAMKQYTRQGYDRGEVITYSWHASNPLNGKSAWHCSRDAVPSILPGGEKHDLYKLWLDRIAAYMQDLKGSDGKDIPVIFRIFHELNGNWFWWGGKNCTSDEFKQLWRFTISYLRDKKNVHNLLYAFSTDRFRSEDEYLEKYPGDDWVDIAGFDIYQHKSLSSKRFAKELSRNLTMLDAIAFSRNKIPALTEFGYNQIPDATWWTKVFLKAVRGHRLAYAMAWRNSGPEEHYVPYPNQRSAEDFIVFYKAGIALFSEQTGRKKLYQRN